MRLVVRAGLLALFIVILYQWWPTQLDPSFIVYGQTTGGGTHTVLFQVTPPSVRAGSADLTLTISGQSLAANSAAYAGTRDQSLEVRLDTTYFSPNTLTAVLPAALLQLGGTLYITVTSPALGNSNSLVFTIIPVPVAVGMVPASAPPGTTFTARFSGHDLANVTSIVFSTPIVNARVLSGGTSNLLLAEVTVSANAPASTYSVSLTDSNATGLAPDLFKVQSARTITDRQQEPLPIPTVEGGSTKTGYIVVTADNPSQASQLVTLTLGMVNSSTVVSQAAVMGSSRSSKLAVVGVDQAPDINRRFGFALVNASNADNQVSLTLLDENGTAIASPTTLTVGPFRQTSRFLSELFTGTPLGTAFKGSLIIQGSQPFAATGLKFAGANFSPVSIASLVDAPTLQTPLNSTNLGSQVLPSIIVFPQFAIGSGWATQVSIVDTSGVASMGRIAWYDSNGQPTNVTMNGETRSVFSYSLPPGGTFTLAPRDSRGQTPF